MSDKSESTETLAEKVKAILALSSLQPGIPEMNELMKVTQEARQVEQVYLDMMPPAFVIQTSHLRY